MLPSVLKRLAAATSKRARSVCGEDARAAARSASELPGKTVDDKKADTQRAFYKHYIKARYNLILVPAFDWAVSLVQEPNKPIMGM